MVLPRAPRYGPPERFSRRVADLDAPATPDEPPLLPRRSWVLAAPPGAYGPVRVWDSAPSWLTSIESFFRSSCGHRWRLDHRYSVSLGTLLAVARTDAARADHRTGRDLATSNEHVARVLGCCAKTVQRARVMLTDAGFYATVALGRYLTLRERQLAAQAHGGRQLRAASTRALTLPSPTNPGIPRPVENVHLPSGQVVNPSSYLVKRSPKRASALRATASRPPARTRGSKSRHPAPAAVPETPRSLEIQRLAGRLVDEARQPRTPLDLRRFLSQLLMRPGQPPAHIGALCAVLEAAGIDPSVWRSWELIGAIAAWYKQTGRRIPEQVESPLRYFAWQLAQAVPPGTLSPAQHAALSLASLAERDARLARQRAEAAAEQARIAAIDQAAVDAVLEQMRQSFPRD